MVLFIYLLILSLKNNKIIIQHSTSARKRVPRVENTSTSLRTRDALQYIQGDFYIREKNYSMISETKVTCYFF